MTSLCKSSGFGTSIPNRVPDDVIAELLKTGVATVVEDKAPFYYEMSRTDFIDSMILSIQKTSGVFKRADIPLTKAFFKSCFKQDDIETFMGEQIRIKDFSKINHKNFFETIKANLKPMNEFTCTSVDQRVAKSFATKHCSTDYVPVVFKVRSNLYLESYKTKYDMGEGEVLLYNPEIVYVVEAGGKIYNKSLDDLIELEKQSGIKRISNLFKGGGK